MFRKLLLTVGTITLLLAACTPAGPAVEATSVETEVPAFSPSTEATPGQPVTLTDGMGREVKLAGPAQKVVSLAPSNTEILFAVGAGAQVAGRDMFSDYPEEAKAATDIGGSMGQFSLEAITALQPDLVLAGGINPPELVASLEELGLTVYFLPNPATLEEMYANLETVGRLTGHETEAAALVESLIVRVQAVDEKIAPLSYRPTVFYELDSTDPAKPYTAGPGTFVDLLIDRAGGFNVGASLQGQWAQISLEQLVVYNPGIILLGDSLFGVTIEAVKTRPGWEVLSAVQNDLIFPFDDNLVSRPGPRLVDGLEALAILLHPGVLE
ncbi:MAG: cobalamin-binding protein [Anaerolineales bacterium]|nr:cobalamin-binding protein [Anaerolineales bacterium]